jgi:hypothetical protein
MNFYRKVVVPDAGAAAISLREIPAAALEANRRLSEPAERLGRLRKLLLRGDLQRSVKLVAEQPDASLIAERGKTSPGIRVRQCPGRVGCGSRLRLQGLPPRCCWRRRLSANQAI